MSYAIRNTLIITGFWALFIIAGVFWVFGHQSRVHSRLLKEKGIKAKKLKELQYLDVSRLELEEYLQRLISIHENTNGVIVSSETPGETYDYLVRELSRSGSSIQFDLRNRGSSKNIQFTTNDYEVVGEGRFLEAYQLLWFLENGPAFYRVNGFEIRRLDAMELAEIDLSANAEVTFLLKLTAFQRDAGPNIKKLNLEQDDSKSLANLFEISRPVRQKAKKAVPNKSIKQTGPNYASRRTRSSEKPTPKKNTTGLPEITQGSKLMAVTPHWVLVTTQSGKTVKLRKGQKVYGGYLSEIRTNTNQVVFQINQGTSPENIVLSVNYKNTGM
jgi:hypothetical protein